MSITVSFSNVRIQGAKVAPVASSHLVTFVQGSVLLYLSCIAYLSSSNNRRISSSMSNMPIRDGTIDLSFNKISIPSLTCSLYTHNSVSTSIRLVLQMVRISGKNNQLPNVFFTKIHQRLFKKTLWE